MSLSDEQAAFFEDICKLRSHANSLGFKVTPGEFERTKEQQEIYFKTGRSKTLNSNHLRRLAADLNFFQGGIWINGLPKKEVLSTLGPLGEYWESLHPLNRWGGNFDKDWNKIDSFFDAPHFERNV